MVSPQKTQPSITNDFRLGYKTEFTGMNFPENAVTETQNCIFTRIGNVKRRPGIDYEQNFSTVNQLRAEDGMSYYKWTNVGGDGNTQVIVRQRGSTLSFYVATNATLAAPLSTTLIPATAFLTDYVAIGGTFDHTAECTYADGNGYLFVFHPSCDPVVITWVPGSPPSVTAAPIYIQIRDFTGIPEMGVPDNTRPSTLSAEHQYNLQNQGWSLGSAWNAAINNDYNLQTGSQTFNVNASSGTAPVNGNIVTIVFTCVIEVPGIGNFPYTAILSGTVTAVALVAGVGTVTINVTSFTESGAPVTQVGQNVGTNVEYVNKNSTGSLVSLGYITSWFTAIGNYPANSDVWWEFKDASGAFAPASTINNVTLDQAPAPRGHNILSAFRQQRSGASGISGLTDIVTLARPTNGAWYQGRLWFTGVSASQQATGDAPYYTWTENIYFSQIIEKTDQFGRCYQAEDPTSETTFNLLPDDGGVIVIQGAGNIYKLFPIQNGILVFAGNGIWFITGNQGLGFTANDYIVTKISSIQTISNRSFVDVRGYPYWWNEEGIYRLLPGQEQGPYRYTGFTVESITLKTIQTFYQAIPLTSIKYAKGAYDPLNFVIRWVYVPTQATDVNGNYNYSGVLTFDTSTEAFYPWTIGQSTNGPFVNGIIYVQNPGGVGNPIPMLKYITSFYTDGGAANYNFTFAEERDTTNWVDFISAVSGGINYTSNFTTGYKIHGGAMNKVQTNYLFIYINNYINMFYRMQGVWIYATSGNTGKYTNLETTQTFSNNNLAVVTRRYRIRGRGLVYQFKVESIDGEPFDLVGWAVEEKINVGS